MECPRAVQECDDPEPVEDLEGFQPDIPDSLHNMEPAKRKRGRPRKSRIETSDVKTTVKRGRRLPRKRPLEEHFHLSEVPVLPSGLPQLPTDALAVHPILSQFSGIHENENICDRIYCEDCGEFFDDPCWFHTTYVENTPVVPFALASLPDCLIIDLCPDSSEKGVFSKDEISPQTVFGPMLGALCRTSPSKVSPFACQDKGGYGIFKQFHMESDYFCNWMRYVRFAENKKEQNLMACVKNDEIVFVTTKDIRPGQELKVWYSRSYAEMLNEFWRRINLKGGVESSEPVDLCNLDLPFDTVDVAHSDVQILFAQEDKDTPDESAIPNDMPADSKPSRRSKRLRQKVPKAVYSDCSHMDGSTGITGTQSSSAVFGPDGLTQSSADLSEEKNKPKRPDVVRTRGKSHLSCMVKYPCVECWIHFPSEEILNLHRYQHSDDAEGMERECPECKTIYAHFEQLIDHVNAHGREYLPREKCPFCDKFIACRCLPPHVRRYHPENYSEWSIEHATLTKPPPKGKTEREPVDYARGVKYPCVECRLNFSSKRMMLLHKRQHEEDTDGDERECPECGMIFVDLERLMKHTKTHGKRYAPRVKCDYCDCFIATSGMGHHLKRVHPEKCPDVQEVGTFPCDVCGKEMRTVELLKVHRSTKHKTKQCILCAKIEPSLRHLGRHALTHQEPDGFHCKECPSVYPSYLRLTAHYYSTHDLKNVATCTVCHKSFRSKPRLVRHMRIHSQSYDFVCEICGTAYRQPDTLRLHIRGVHEADDREKFKQRYQERKRTGQRKKYVDPRKRMMYEDFPFKCQLCRQGFLVEGKLARHQQRLHAGDTAG